MLKILIAVALIYVVYCGLLYFCQRWIIFPRDMTGSPPPPDFARLGVQAAWLNTSAGPVETWFIGPETGRYPCPVMIMAHGNGELIDYQLQEARLFSRMGLGVLLVEYPGYGRSAGTPSERSITEAFIMAYDKLIQSQPVDPSRLVFFGRSLGGGAVCGLARHRPCAAMILVSTFTSTRQMAKRYLAPSFLIKDPFDNLAVVSSFQGPILFFHGQYDSIIPYHHGITLAKAAQRGTLVTYPCDHNDLPPDLNAYADEIRSFLLEHGVLEAGNHE